MINKKSYPLFRMSLLSAAIAAVAAHSSVVIAAEKAETEEVVVTGYRAALQNSTAAKRDAVGFSDSIFADDIGKLPSQNLAESLNRIPGVKIAREVTGEGLQISVRGLGASFTKVTLNGNNMAVASDGALDSGARGRETDLGMFPAELFSSLSVDKSAKANQMEGGITGYVNMRTMRPFDKAGQRISFSLEGAYTDINKQTSPKASFIYSNTFDDDKFGVLVGLTTSDMKSRVDGYETVGYTDGCLVADPGLAPAGATGWACRSKAGGYPADDVGRNQVQWNPKATPDYVATHPGTTLGQTLDVTKTAGVSATALDHALVPYLGRVMRLEGNRDATTELVSLQYKFNDDMTGTLDVMASQAHRKFNRIDNMLWIRRAAQQADALIPENVTVNADEVMTQATFYNSSRFIEARDYDEKVHFVSYMPSFEWQVTDLFKVNLSASKTVSGFDRDYPRFLYQTPKGITTYSVGKNDIPSFTFTVPGSNFTQSGLTGWIWSGGGSTTDRGSYVNDVRTTETSGYHADFGLGEDPAKKGIQFGISSDKSARFMQSYGSPTMQALTAALSPTPDKFLTSTLKDFGSTMPASMGIDTWAQIDYSAIKKALDYNTTIKNSATRGGDEFGQVVGDIDETYKAAYIMINDESELVGKTLHTNMGLRYVDSDQWVGSFDTAHAVELSTDSSYGVWLPSFSAVYDAFDDIKFRGSASRTMTRANPADMYPNASWGSSGIDKINAGNPKLAPYFSDNVDLGGEWYFSKLGYVGFTYFNKKVAGFTYSNNITMNIQQAIAQTGVFVDTGRQTTIAADTTVNTTVATKLNANGYTNIRGSEINWVQPLDFIVNGLGFDVSATHLTQWSSDPLAEVTGISPWAYNLTGSYDRDNFSARVTYYHQDKSKNSGPTDGNYDGSPLPYRAMYGLARSQVDLSASYTLPFKIAGDGELVVTFDVYNLTNEAVGSWYQYEKVPFSYYNPGTTYTFGIRGKF